MYGGTIYVTSFTTLLPSPGYYYASTMLYALNASTGAVSWHTALGRTDYLVTVVGGAAYLVDTGTDVVCEPHLLHVLSARDGTERWHREGTLLRLIGVEQGRLYVAVVPDGCAARSYAHVALSALNTSDGSPSWELDLQSPYGGSLANGVIYLPMEGAALAAYRVRDGSQLWYVQAEIGLVRVWVVDSGIYVSLMGQGLDALDPATGAVRWRYRPGDDVWFETVVNGVLVGVRMHRADDLSQSQELIALTARDGTLLWSVPVTLRQDALLVG
jgi:outer membrane protein assembly factor BamB